MFVKNDKKQRVKRQTAFSMEKKMVAKNKIEHALAYIVTRVKLSNKLNFTDINIVAEDFFKDLLNLVYGFNLQNANAKKPNESAIDIYFTAEKIAYQITSQNKPQKIRQSVDSFIKSKKHEQFSKFAILSITDQRKCNSDGLADLGEFGVEGSYINISDLEKDIFYNCDTDKLELIAEFLSYETNPHAKKKDAKQKTFVDEKLKSLHIVDQILTVLNKFDGFKCIHPRTLSKLYPFNTEKRTYDTYSHYCLKTNNKEIHELLQKVKVNNNKEIELLDESLRPFSEKIEKILTILNYSLVQCIAYREKYTEIEHHKILIVKNNADCTCYQCQYQHFKLQSLFPLLKEKAIKPSENLVEALSEGYYLCKIGESIKGWQVFNFIASKSNEENRPIIHFLAQHNSLAIYNFVDSPWWESEAKAILPKIDEIDLHNLISHLDIPIIVRDELIKVKEDYHLHQSRQRIEEQAESIRETKVLYANKGYSSGTSAPNLLCEEIHLLFSFHSLNSIISDDFFMFRATITKAVDALLDSYTTDARYQYRYKTFDSFIISMMLFYIDEDSMKRIFKSYGILTIGMVDSEKKAFIEGIANFFSAQFTTNAWTGAQFYSDIKRQEYFSHYRQLLRHLFNRSMLILSKLDLSNEDLKPLTQPFIDFLKSAEDLNHSSWKFAAKFFEGHIQAFDYKQIQDILEVILSEKNHRNGDKFIIKICNSAAKKARFVIKDQSLFLKLFSRVSNPCSACNRIHDFTQILAFWNIAEESGKQLIKQKAIEYLDNTFDADFYQEAVWTGVFNKDEHSSFLQQYIVYAQNNCHKHDLQEENGHWIFHSYIGYNCINCFDYLHLDFNEESIQAIAQKSDYYNWLINFKHYDYSNFNFKWLIEACPQYLKPQLHTVKSLKEKVAMQLAKEYDENLAAFYIKNLLK
jgi:hypothetical protein